MATDLIKARIYYDLATAEWMAKEVNTVTNPKMGKRHENYESMLRSWKVIEDKCDGFCSGECQALGCRMKPEEGRILMVRPDADGEPTCEIVDICAETV